VVRKPRLDKCHESGGLFKVGQYNGWDEWCSLLDCPAASGSLSNDLPSNCPPLNSQWVLPVDLGLDCLVLTPRFPAAVAFQSRWPPPVDRSHYRSEDGVFRRGRSFASRSAAFQARARVFPRRRLSSRCFVLLFRGDVCFADHSSSDVWFSFQKHSQHKSKLVSIFKTSLEICLLSVLSWIPWIVSQCSCLILSDCAKTVTQVVGSVSLTSEGRRSKKWGGSNRLVLTA